MNLSSTGIAAAMLALPLLAAQAMTTAEFASKAPAAPPAQTTSGAPARAASAAAPTPPVHMQRQAEDKARVATPSAPKPAQR